MVSYTNTQVTTDGSGFFSGSAALEQHLLNAKIPEVDGVAGVVVGALQERVGRAPMTIRHVAEDLNFSTRTLQRRLQKQDVNFADLRDQIRFNAAIDYLIHESSSIDSISRSLDFSDRTSFTNAFKRWTGLSPTSFRKLFRDYV